jgi:hypothetical protein
MDDKGAKVVMKVMMKNVKGMKWITRVRKW